MISEKALNDGQALSVAEAIAIANEAAQQAGVYQRKVRMMIEERTADDGTPLWRINYLPVPPPGVFIRGGDYTVEVTMSDSRIYRVLQGQ